MSEALDGLERAHYDYDFGDGWRHELVVEGVSLIPSPLAHAVCLAGERACPPEDIGGPPGYRELLSGAMQDRAPGGTLFQAPDGRPFEPARFELATVNAARQQIR